MKLSKHQKEILHLINQDGWFIHHYICTETRYDPFYALLVTALGDEGPKGWPIVSVTPLLKGWLESEV